VCLGGGTTAGTDPRLYRACLPYQLKFRGFGDQHRVLEQQPVQRLCYACDEYSHQFFINDHENPYTFPADKPFMWIRGRQVGGKTFCWARESYRYSDYEFKAASRDGYFVCAAHKPETSSTKHATAVSQAAPRTILKQRIGFCLERRQKLQPAGSATAFLARMVALLIRGLAQNPTLSTQPKVT